MYANTCAHFLSRLVQFFKSCAVPCILARLACETYMSGHISADSRDRIVVSTSRCGRDNPSSNPGHGKLL